MDTKLGLVHRTETIMHGATHHTLLTFDPKPGLWRDSIGIPFTDHCELFIQRSEWMMFAVITCIILKHCSTCTVVPC